MQYIEVKIETSAQAAELLADELAAVTGGCEVDDPRTIDDFIATPGTRWDYIDEQLFENPSREPTVKFCLACDEGGHNMLRQVAEMINAIRQSDESGFYGSLRVDVAPMENQDWETSWKQFFKPQDIGSRLHLCPSWEADTLPPGRTLLLIDPSSSFGTGTHATTRLCLEQLDGLRLDGVRVLDLGCGSGILACAALRLGARYAVCCDIEENAMTATCENMRRNCIPDGMYYTVRGDIGADGDVLARVAEGGPYDIILANIVADVLIGVSGLLPALLADRGRVILSGIISRRADEVEAAYVAEGMRVEYERECEGWTMLSVKKQ